MSMKRTAKQLRRTQKKLHRAAKNKLRGSTAFRERCLELAMTGPPAYMDIASFYQLTAGMPRYPGIKLIRRARTKTLGISTRSY